jgi:adenine deaminase
MGNVIHAVAKIETRRKDLVPVALGQVDADLVLKGGHLIDVFSGQIRRTDVAIKGERIAYVGDVDHTIGQRTQVIDATGCHLTPGLIDAHVHIEASMVTPTQFARAVLPTGNTAVLWETLWTANMLGVRGIKYFLEETARTPLKVFAALASGVPPTSPDLVTAVHEFGADEFAELLALDQVVSLGELVLVNEIFQGDSRVHEHIQLALDLGKRVDGSAPDFARKELAAYSAAGAQSDHEAMTVADAIERIRLGMRLILREGSGFSNVAEPIKAITEHKLDPRRVCFCVDDKDIRDVVETGAIDNLVRKAIKAGIEPVIAVQMGSLNAAEYIGVDHDLGGIAPGMIADILLVDNLEDFEVRKVMVNGEIIAEDGMLTVDISPPEYPDWVSNTVRIRRVFEPDDFAYRTDKDQEAKVRVISVLPDQGISFEETELLAVENGEILLPAHSDRDLLKVAVIERHGKTASNIAKGIVKGFGFKEGAIATCIAPDINQMILVGAANEDLARAANRMVEIQGGVIICKNGELVSELPLPIAGTMSPRPYEETVPSLDQLHRAARDLGCALPSPLMTMAFVGCPAMPYLKLSDKGLVDVVAGKIVHLEVG